MNYTKKYFKTDAGVLSLKIIDNKIHEAIFCDNSETQDYLSSQEISELKLYLFGTEFQVKVWKVAMQIPAGQTTSYQDIAIYLGSPKAYRAVANALAQNKIAYFVPCHRVVQKNGKLGGYKWGLEKKELLLKSEAN